MYIYICILKASQDVKCGRRCDASTDPQNQFDGPQSAASSSNLVGVPTNCNEKNSVQRQLESSKDTFNRGL